jgi:hypothetical protein
MKTLRSTIALTILFSLLLALAPSAGITSAGSARAAAAFAVPVASSFSTAVAANRQNRIVLQGVDPDGTALVYATTSSPAHGALSALDSGGGAVIYTPNANYVGADSFTYTVTSGGETSAPGTVTLTVTNAKTRIIDTVTDASGAPRSGKMTFILTQTTTSPGGLTPKGASVSASLNNQGQFDVSVYPSRSMSPAAYYQVYHVDANSNQTLLGIYDIPLSVSTINLAPYKVLDTNLAAQYTFASSAAVTQLSTAVASATKTTLLGISPANNALQKYNSTLGTFTNSSITDTGSAVSVATNATVAGTLTATGAVTAENVALAAATKGMIKAGQLPYSPDYLKGFVAFYDANTLDLAEGAAVSSWTDLSGNGRHAVQATGANQPTFHLSETFTEAKGAYVTGNDATDALTVPLPASSTKVICAAARFQSPASAGFYTFYVDAQNWLSTIVPASGGRWYANQKNTTGATTPAGFSNHYSNVCLRMNSASSISTFVDGALVETYTPLDGDLATATSLQIGPGFGHIKQFYIFDYGRAATDAEMLEHSDMAHGYNRTQIEWEWVGRTSAGDYAPTLASEGFIARKRGLRGKRPLVILNHQAAQTEYVFSTVGEPQRAVLDALIAQDYIVIASRQWTPSAFENSWGNDDALQANVDLYNYAVANYNVDTSRVAMVGFSMGGISTMVAFDDGRIPLDGAACFDCALDLEHVYANGFSSAINAAYQIGGAGGTYAAATSGHDPRLLATTGFSGKRFAFFANTDDSIINFTENTFDFQAQIASVATEETITTGTGGHLANISSNIPNLTAFLQRCFQ